MHVQSQQLEWETDEFADDLQQIHSFVHETARLDQEREWMSDIVRQMKGEVDELDPDGSQTMADIFVERLHDFEQRNNDDIRFGS